MCAAVAEQATRLARNLVVHGLMLGVAVACRLLACQPWAS